MSRLPANEFDISVKALPQPHSSGRGSTRCIASLLQALASHSQEETSENYGVRLLHDWNNTDWLGCLHQTRFSYVVAMPDVNVGSPPMPAPHVEFLQRQLAEQAQQMRGMMAQIEQIQRSIRYFEENKVSKIEAKKATLSEAEIDFLEEQIPVLAEGAFNAAFLNTLAQGQSATVARDGAMVEVAPDGTVTQKGEMPTGGNLPDGTFIAFP